MNSESASICRLINAERDNRPYPVYLSAVRNPLPCEYRDFLTERETHAYFDKKTIKTKQNYLLGRYALKLASCAYMNKTKMSMIETDTGVLRYPFIQASDPHIPDVSLTHTDTVALALAFPRGHDSGIDIEYVRREKENVYDRIMNEDEHKILEAIGDEKLRLECMVWTMKEALSKAVHCGFTVPFEILSIKSFDKKNLSDAGSTYEAFFTHFGQFKGHGTFCGNWAVSVVMPYNTSFPASWAEELSLAELPKILSAVRLAAEAEDHTVHQ